MITHKHRWPKEILLTLFTDASDRVLREISDNPTCPIRPEDHLPDLNPGLVCKITQSRNIVAHGFVVNYHNSIHCNILLPNTFVYSRGLYYPLSFPGFPEIGKYKLKTKWSYHDVIARIYSVMVHEFCHVWERYVNRVCKTEHMKEPFPFNGRIRSRRTKHAYRQEEIRANAMQQLAEKEQWIDNHQSEIDNLRAFYESAHFSHLNLANGQILAM